MKSPALWLHLVGVTFSAKQDQLTELLSELVADGDDADGSCKPHQTYALDFLAY